MPEIRTLNRVSSGGAHVESAESGTVHTMHGSTQGAGQPTQVTQGNIHISGVSSGTVRPMRETVNRVIYNGGGGGLPPGGRAGDLLAKRTSADSDAVWITPAAEAQADNTKPITSAAVYREIGNINALLATI